MAAPWQAALLGAVLVIVIAVLEGRVAAAIDPSYPSSWMKALKVSDIANMCCATCDAVLFRDTRSAQRVSPSAPAPPRVPQVGSFDAPTRCVAGG
jgi:hypothetical protein